MSVCICDGDMLIFGVSFEGILSKTAPFNEACTKKKKNLN